MNFRQQNTVGRDFDHGIVLHAIGEAHLVANQLADFRLQLLRNARRDTAGLGSAEGAEIPRLSARQILGNCVAFSRLVAPQTVTAWFAAMARWISAHLLAIRSIPLKLVCGSGSWRCFALALES